MNLQPLVCDLINRYLLFLDELSINETAGGKSKPNTAGVFESLARVTAASPILDRASLVWQTFSRYLRTWTGLTDLHGDHPHPLLSTEAIFLVIQKSCHVRPYSSAFLRPLTPHLAQFPICSWIKSSVRSCRNQAWPDKPRHKRSIRNKLAKCILKLRKP